MAPSLTVVGAAAAAAAALAYYIHKTRSKGQSGGEVAASLPSEAQAEYLAAFAPQHSSDPFLTYYQVGDDKKLRAKKYTRGEFYEMALRAAAVMASTGLQPGDSVTHFFSCNTLGDLAFRLASVMLGTVPVTINWQADTVDKVLYKVTLTGSRLCIVDDETPAADIARLRKECPELQIFNVSALPRVAPMSASTHAAAVSAAAGATAADASRIVIFTSGTTGNPKGVRLPYKAYRCNQKTFESFLQAGDGKSLVGVVVNPMHHTNSTSITDWALRKVGSEVHLLQRYTTQYWSVLARAGTSLAIDADGSGDKLLAAIKARNASAKAVVVAPLVSRHFDFLDALITEGKLPISQAEMLSAMEPTILLLGSAPVGPTTVARLQKYAGKLPTVRFGSTETCLQVMGTPLYLSEAERLAAFQAGWKHSYNGQEQVGYYIGRPHPPFTEVRVVKSIDAKAAAAGFVDCEDGEPGQLITRGNNLMAGYVGNDEATKKAIGGPGGWYTNLGDVCFRLKSPVNGAGPRAPGYDYYWQSRDSALLIRGGANYAYEQINAELQSFIASSFGVAPELVEVAVIGMRVESEHEDSCCVTVELLGAAAEKRAEIEESFLKLAKKGVSKGAKPDHVRFAPLPRNFKGVVKVPDLKTEWAKVVADLKAK